MADTLQAVPKKELHILIVGPSWIVGMFPASKIAEIERDFSERAGVPVKLDVVAKVGEGIGWMQAQLKKTLETHPPGYYDSVVFFPGRNDIKKKGAGEITRNILDTVDMMQGVGRVFLFNVQYSDSRLFGDHLPKIDKINASLQKQFGSDSKVILLDLHDYTRKHKLGYPLHPSGAAYANLRNWSIDLMAGQLVHEKQITRTKTPLSTL